MAEPLCGKQLSSEELIEKQKPIASASMNTSAGVIITDNIRTPENLAAIYRLAEAAGINEIVVINEAGENNFSANKLKRMSRNAMRVLNITRCTEAEFLNIYKNYPPMLALEICSGSDDLFATRLPECCSFIVGNERFGISPSILDLCTRAVHIPMYGSNGSMNVTHALAICLYEWRRQLTTRDK